MPQANQLSTNNESPQTIAGQYGGRKIKCTSLTNTTYQNIRQLAKKNNYWAMLIIKTINGLTSGRLHQDNIYIHSNNPLAAGKGTPFHVVLPGVTASLVEQPNGSFLLYRIKADLSYLEQQKNGSKPGLWNIPKDAQQKPIFLNNGKITSKHSAVVISDMASDGPGDIAKAVVNDTNSSKNDLLKTRFKSEDGFELHHTPGDRGITGLKKTKDALSTSKDSEIVKSATLLAHTMYNARKLDSVMWYSEWGGSAILTRALQILHHEKNIKLNNHMIFMNRPTSVPNEAIEIAKKIGFQTLDNNQVTGLSKAELKGRIIHNFSGKGAKKVALSTLGDAGAGFSLAGATALALPAVSTMVTVGAAVGLAGGLMHVAKSVVTGKKAFKQKQYK